MTRKTKNKIARVILFLFVILVVAMNVNTISRVKVLRGLTKGPDQSGEVGISWDRQKDLVYGDVYFKTGSETENEKISTIAFRLTIPKNGQEVVVVDENGNKTDLITKDRELADSQEWEFPVNTVTEDDEKIIIDFSAVYLNQTGISASGYIKLARIYFDSDTFPLKGEFDENLSVMYSLNRPVTNIWLQ